jgi:hypothetical protein
MLLGQDAHTKVVSQLQLEMRLERILEQGWVEFERENPEVKVLRSTRSTRMTQGHCANDEHQDEGRQQE